MFKKFNWGWGIAIVYTGFVCFMLFMVWMSTQLKTELVTNDYYGKELKFQEQLDKMRRSNVLTDTVSWMVVNKKEVRLQFPHEVNGKEVKAQILFYRPDNSLHDFNVTCQPDSTGICVVNSDKFLHGAYKMEVDWSAGKETYYTEGVVNIN